MSLLVKNIYIFIQTHKDVLFSSLKKEYKFTYKKEKTWHSHTKQLLNNPAYGHTKCYDKLRNKCQKNS